MASHVVTAAEWAHAGPLFDDYSLTLVDGHRTEAAGPLFYSEWADTQHTWGVPPFCWGMNDHGADVDKFALVYPFLTWNRYGTEYRWQLFQLLSFAGGQNQDQPPARRFTVFPLYFSQRSPDTNLNYTAFLPFYGHLRGRIFTDEMFFVMLPLYLKSRKGEVITESWLFPVYSRSTGGGVDGWKLFPLAGHQHKEITTRSIGFGDTEPVPGYDRRFITPLYYRQQSGIGSDNPTDELAFLPFYSSSRSPQRDSTAALMLFSHVTDRARKYSEWQLPWPLFVFARGEGKTTTRVWPLYSHAQNANAQSDFVLWPVYKYNRFHNDVVDRRRTRWCLFLYSDIVQKNLATEKTRRRQDFFPLFTRTVDYNGNERLQILAIAEPIYPFSENIEREYSPAWSLWRAEKNPATGSRGQSLLWNFYRRSTTPLTKKVSLFFGLFQYQSSPTGTETRWFYLPAASARNNPAADARFDESSVPAK
ncbi:MAG: hypothetical protein U1F65_02830 [Verrucomicrobiota bacterium]